MRRAPPAALAPPLPRVRRVVRPALLTLTLALLGLSAAQTAPATQTAPVTPNTPSSNTPSSSTPASVLTLEQALNLLNQAPNVTQARLSVQVAQANLNAARTALGLTVSVNGNAAYSGAYDTTTSAGSTVNVPSTLGGSAGVNVSLGVLPWSSNQYALKAAQRSLNLAQANLNDAIRSARLNVAQQYYNVVNAQATVALAEQTVTLRQRQLQVVQAQQANGNATAENVLSAQATLQSAQASLTQAQGTLDTARRSLSVALGSDVSAATFSSLPGEQITLPDLAGLVGSARTSRTEVVQALNNLQAAQDTLEQDQRTAALPSLTTTVRYGPAGSGGLNASLDVQKGTLSAGYSQPWGDGSGNDSNRFVASIAGSYVIYSPAAKAQLAADQANVTQYQLSLSVAQQNVELDVRSKYNAAQTAALNLQAAQTQVQLAQTALQTAQTRLDAGVGTQDDVSQATLNLQQAQNALLQARVTAQIALIQVLNAAGGTP